MQINPNSTFSLYAVVISKIGTFYCVWVAKPHTKCEEQTGYSYPLFALRNAWEHILNTETNVVTILEIVYDRGIIHENKRVKIELMIK
jgi:hypothetical protein